MMDHIINMDIGMRRKQWLTSKKREGRETGRRWSMTDVVCDLIDKAIEADKANEKDWRFKR